LIYYKPVGIPRNNFYANWRAQNQARLFLREPDEPNPPERLVQSIWHHQRILRDQLRTLDQRSIRVLHPGFWNHGAGPDFKSAVIQFEGEPPKSGDVEIDLVPAGWRGHGHDRNAAFSNVILHVVWNKSESNTTLNTLALEPFLDAPVAELTSAIGGETGNKWPDELRGKCCAPLNELPTERVVELLQQAAWIRLQRKAGELEARARQAGWEQALWEGLFRALGYKQNVWPMQRLAEILPRTTDRETSTLGLQARFFGSAGLLPDAAGNERSQPYLRSLWDIWWREREKFSDIALPPTLWRFHGLRPANQPQRRLALAAHWVCAPKFLQRLEQWFVDDNSTESAIQSLLECLQPDCDEFWSWHWSLRSARLSKPQPLLGSSRVTDLAINVILPWFWIRAHAGKNQKLEALAEKRYFDWPAAQDNSVLKLARQRLLGGRQLRGATTAAAQQGLLQIVRDFCEHTDAVCTDCLFPDLVRSWNASAR
jgi:hypothetical protein